MNIREKILVFFPESNLIKNQLLREKTLSVWEDALQNGDWKVDDLQKIPFTLLVPECQVNIVDHTRAVTNSALAAAYEMVKFHNNFFTIDFDILLSGALLHDVGKLLEYEWSDNLIQTSQRGKLLRHPITGAGLAMKHDLPDKVIHIIAVHSKEGNDGYRCPEAVIIHHADFMNFEPFRMR
jgi:putative nucleotidyltransferase with HDIG domain